MTGTSSLDVLCYHIIFSGMDLRSIVSKTGWWYRDFIASLPGGTFVLERLTRVRPFGNGRPRVLYDLTLNNLVLL